MHIVANRFEITSFTSIYRQGLVTTAEQMPEKLVLAVESAGEGAQKPFHPIDQIGPRGFEHHVKMILHQAIRVHLPAGLLAGFRQGRKKHLTVFVLQEYLLASITAAQHMVNRPLILHARFSGHWTESVPEILV